jgi:hypothetical protein
VTIIFSITGYIKHEIKWSMRSERKNIFNVKVCSWTIRKSKKWSHLFRQFSSKWNRPCSSYKSSFMIQFFFFSRPTNFFSFFLNFIFFLILYSHNFDKQKEEKKNCKFCLKTVLLTRITIKYIHKVANKKNNFSRLLSLPVIVGACSFCFTHLFIILWTTF